MTTLRYASAKVRWYRLPWVRRGCAAGCAAVVGIASWRWGMPAVAYARTHYLQQQCLAYAPPEGAVVYDGPPDMTASGASPAPELLRFVDAAALPRPTGRVTVFLHERTAADGTRQLVSVQILGPRVQSINPMACAVAAQAYSIGTLAERPAQRQPLAGECWLPGLDLRLGEGTSRLRLFAGQPDPADPSRFTIRFETDSGTGVIVGRLVAPDQVDLQVR